MVTLPKFVVPLGENQVACSDSSAPLLVAVHPWFKLNERKNNGLDYCMAKIDSSPLQGAGSSYLENLDLLFLQHRGPLVILEDMAGVVTTVPKLLAVPPQAERYLVATILGESFPAFGGEISDLTGFIRSFRRDVLLAGGYLPRTLDLCNPSGCLGNLCSWMSTDDIPYRFVEGCCYTSEVNL